MEEQLFAVVVRAEQRLASCALGEGVQSGVLARAMRFAQPTVVPRVSKKYLGLQRWRGEIGLLEIGASDQ